MSKQMRIAVIVLGLAIAMPLARCNKSQDAGPDHGGHIAVIDLDRIIEEIGYKSKFEEYANILEHNLQVEIFKLKKKVQDELIKLTREIGGKPEVKGDKPTEAEQKLIDEWTGKKQHVEKMLVNVEKKLTRAIKQQRESHKKKIDDQIANIRKAIAPLAQKFAAGKDRDIVAPTSSIIAHANAVDVTDDTLKEVTKQIEAGDFPTVTIPKLAKAPVNCRCYSPVCSCPPLEINLKQALQGIAQ